MNGPTHRLVAGAITAVYMGHQEKKLGVATGAPIAGGVLCSILTALPDILEPATSPNHRQFFHGIAFAALLARGHAKLDEWTPQTADQELLRNLGKLAIAGYLIHLALDATTRRSLPFIGKL